MHAEQEASSAANVANVDDVMQRAAEQQGLRHQRRGRARRAADRYAGQCVICRPKSGRQKLNHPCYSEAAHHHYARMHVAVAPACNIQCNYCNRKYDCANELRPGVVVVSEKLTPEQAAKESAGDRAAPISSR